VSAAGIRVTSDDLARVVDAKRLRAKGSKGIVEGEVSAAAFEVSVHAPDPVNEPLKKPDDLVRIIDAHCIGGAGKCRGVLEGVEYVDWHDLAPCLPKR
jgi:hypothetical protein